MPISAFLASREFRLAKPLTRCGVFGSVDGQSGGRVRVGASGVINYFNKCSRTFLGISCFFYNSLAMAETMSEGVG